MSKKEKHNVVIAFNLKEFRKNKKWTQYEVSDELYKRGYKISRDSYAQLETGTRNIPVGLLVKLRELYDIDSYDEFFLDGNNDLI